MIRVLVIVSFLATPLLAKARTEEDEGKPAQRHRVNRHLDIQIPGIPGLPLLPQIDLSAIEIDLPELLASAMPHDHDVDVDVDDDEDHETNHDVEVDEDRDGNVKVYKLNRQRSIRLPRMRIGEDDSESDEENATARSRGRGSATLQVKGPVTFQVRAQAGEVEVIATDKRQVTVTLSDAPAEDIALYAFGDRVEPAFRGRRTLRRGKLRVELPRGSRLDVASMSGDVTAQRIGDR